jgi:hypothetical protein
MVEAFLNDLVSALASSGGRAVAGAVASAIGRLAAGLRDKFRKDPTARGALEIVVDDPGDVEAKENLAVLLDQHVKQDPEFSAWLRTEWGLVRPLIAQVDRSVANTVCGNVSGNVVQARDIEGGVHVGLPRAETPVDE